MKKYVSRALWCALLAGGLTVLGATAANAADSGGEDGLASGNQILSFITAPVAVDGNAISLLGDSASSGTSTAPAVVADGSDSAVTDGGDGVASGNQVSPDVTAPVAVEGNAISLLGDSTSNGTSTGPAAVPGDENEGILDFGDDNEGILDFGNGDQGILNFGDENDGTVRLGFATQAGTDGNVADERIGDNEGILDFGSNSPRVLRLGFATQAGAAVDGNVADVPADDNTAEGPTSTVVIQGASAGTAGGDLQTLALSESTATEGDLSTQALAATGGQPGNGATAAALMLGAGLMLITVARRKSLQL